MSLYCSKGFYFWVQWTSPWCHIAVGRVDKVDALVFWVSDEEIDGEVWPYIPAYLGPLFFFRDPNWSWCRKIICLSSLPTLLHIVPTISWWGPVHLEFHCSWPQNHQPLMEIGWACSDIFTSPGCVVSVWFRVLLVISLIACLSVDLLVPIHTCLCLFEHKHIRRAQIHLSCIILGLNLGWVWWECTYILDPLLVCWGRSFSCLLSWILHLPRKSHCWVIT